MKPTTTDRPYLTCNEAARLLGISDRQLRVWQARRQGPPSVRINGVRRYRLRDIEVWLERLKAQP